MASGITVTMQQLSQTATQGTARTHSVVIDRPIEKEGTDEGMMGGEMLLVALGGCFMSNLLAAVRSRNAAVSDIEVAITGEQSGAPTRFTAIEMAITARYDDAELMEKLVTIAERACLVANTLKGALPITIRFETQPATR